MAQNQDQDWDCGMDRVDMMASDVHLNSNVLLPGFELLVYFDWIGSGRWVRQDQNGQEGSDGKEAFYEIHIETLKGKEKAKM